MTFAPLKDKASARPTPALMRAISWPVIFVTRAIQDLRVSGQHNLPATGPALLVANHTSHLDPLVVAVALYEAGIPPVFVAKKEVFVGPLAPILRGLGQIRVDRDNPQGIIDEIVARLDEGACVVLYPEGTFTKDPAGWPMRAKTGIARVAAARPNVPIIPVAHWGNERIVHQWTGKINWSRILKRTETVLVHFGPAVELRGETLAEKANSVMTVIAHDVARLRRKLGRDMGRAPEERFVPPATPRSSRPTLSSRDG